MEVSQQSDHITHAVIGSKESVQMGVSNSATLMHVLSTALYTHPQLASVREIICNGWDGHIISGNTATPLQVTIDDQFIKIRDFGPGIPHEKIGEIYGTYGNSTKRHDGQQTGGFGLGSKAPFAYTDNFEVINHHGGEKIIYRVSKSSMAAGGSPSIDTIVKVPSTETGIQVSMNIKSPRDMGMFRELVEEICLLGEIKATVNGGEILPMLPLSESPTGYIINSADGTLITRINVRYGNVVYPVPKLEAYADIWESVNKVLIGLWQSANVIFMAKPDTITIAPSREALIFTEGTTETIKRLLATFNPDSAKSSPNTARQVTNTQINKIIPTERYVHPGHLKQSLMLTAERGTSATVAGGIYNFDARKAAVSFAISRRSLGIEGDRLVFKRLKNAIFHGLVDKHPAKVFLRAAQKHQAYRSGKLAQMRLGANGRQIALTADSFLRKALHKHVTWPLMDAIKAHDFMDVGMITYCQQDYHWYDGKVCNPWRFTVGDAATLFGFLRPKILLARSQRAIKEFLSERCNKEPNQVMAGWMVYQLPKSEKHYAEIKKVFVDLGYEVHTYLPVVERAERAKKSDDPNYVPPVKKATPKRKGYLSLFCAYDGSEFTLTRAREKCTPELHVFNPIAYVVLNSGSDYQRRRFKTIDEQSVCQDIWRVFGRQIAVVTSTQTEKLDKLGVPELSKFIYQHVDDTLAAKQDFRRWLAFGKYVQTIHSRAEGKEGILQGLTQHADLAAGLPGKPFRFCVSGETLAYADLYNNQGFRSVGMPKCKELAKKVKRSPAVTEMLQQLGNSPWLQYIDVDAVAGALHRKAPNDESLAIPYQIVTNLLTPMEQ